MTVDLPRGSCSRSRDAWSARSDTRLKPHQKEARRRAIRARDGDGCFYCLQSLGQDATLEHLLDKRLKGGHHPDNLVLAHRFCNEAVRGLTLDEKLLRRGDVLLAWLAGEDLVPWDGRATIGMGIGQMRDLRRQLAAFGEAA